jgi:hypothetical protein
MDGRTFDAVAKRLGTGPSRRSVFKGLVGGLGASLILVLGRHPVDAARCATGKHHCKGGGCKECCKDRHCPTGQPCRNDGTCDPGPDPDPGGGGGEPLPVCAPPPYPQGIGCGNTPTCTCTAGTTCFQGTCCIPFGSREGSVELYFCCASTSIERPDGSYCCGSPGVASCNLPSECCSGICTSGTCGNFPAG